MSTVARYSQLFIPTLKEAPADAQVVSHKLLIRAGFIRQLGAGLWPLAIAPYRAIVLTMGKEPELARAAEQVCAALAGAGLDVLYDDREERAGVKFKDADLLGIPVRVAVGKRGLADGKVEWKRRAAADVELVALGDVAARAAAVVAGAGAGAGAEG